MKDQEAGDNEQIPIRLWIYKHYTKLTEEKAAKCNYCTSKFFIRINDYGKYHRHLVKEHPDKLTENEKEEEKFGWFWDYFTPKNNMTAMCNFCHNIYKYYKFSNANLIKHLKKYHRITISARAHEDRDDTNMDTTKINAKRQQDSEALSSNLFKNTEKANVHNRKSEATFEQKTEDDKQIPIRVWIRRHYTKLTEEKAAKCNYCISKFSIYIKDYGKFHRHLVEEHPNKLTKKEKEEKKFGWFWDYFTPKNNMTAMCNFCHIICKYHKVSNANLITHLKKCHRLTISASAHGDKDDTNMDTTKINAKRQEDSEASSSNLFKNMEETNIHNRKSEATFEQKTEDDKQIPICVWIRRHYTKLTEEKAAKCNYCISKFSIYDDNDYEIFHRHLIKEHPNKLTDDKKEEDKFSWMWNYFTLKNNIYAMCNFCDNIIKLYNKSEYTLKTHLKVYHGITGADSNTDGANNDANRNTVIQKAEYQEDLADLCNNLCKNTESTSTQIAKRFCAKTHNAMLAYDVGNLPYVRLQRL